MNLYYIRAMDISAGEDLDLIVSAHSYSGAVNIWLDHYEARDSYEDFQLHERPGTDDTVDEIRITMLTPPEAPGVVAWWADEENTRWVTLDWNTEEAEN